MDAILHAGSSVGPNYQGSRRVFKRVGAPTKPTSEGNAVINKPPASTAETNATDLGICGLDNMDSETKAKYDGQSQELRIELKTWEGNWVKAHGKKPGKEDIKQNPDIGILTFVPSSPAHPH